MSLPASTTTTEPTTADVTNTPWSNNRPSRLSVVVLAQQEFAVYLDPAIRLTCRYPQREMVALIEICSFLLDDTEPHIVQLNSHTEWRNGMRSITSTELIRRPLADTTPIIT